MASASEAFDFQGALHNPALFFHEPDAVLRHAALTRQMKIDLLEQWERDARGLMVAEEEGMSGGETDRLDYIRKALHTLKGHNTNETGNGTKHG